MDGGRIKVFALLVTVLALALAAPAYAGSTTSGYGGGGGHVENLVAGGGNIGTKGGGSNEPTGGGGAKAGGLPFTGLDVGLLLAGGVLLVGAGAGLSRLHARSASRSVA